MIVSAPPNTRNSRRWARTWPRGSSILEMTPVEGLERGTWYAEVLVKEHSSTAVDGAMVNVVQMMKEA